MTYYSEEDANMADHVDATDAAIRGWEDEYADGYEFPGTCPVCAWNIDYCQGHGELGDWEGYVTLAAHDVDHHEYCHGQAECVMADWEPEPY